MEIEKAIEDLKSLMERSIEQSELFRERHEESFTLAIQALEKQIPKKPIKDREQNIRYTSAYSCPLCGGNFTGTGIADYCYHCGQKLDWEEEE